MFTVYAPKGKGKEEKEEKEEKAEKEEKEERVLEDEKAKLSSPSSQVHNSFTFSTTFVSNSRQIASRWLRMSIILPGLSAVRVLCATSRLYLLSHLPTNCELMHM